MSGSRSACLLVVLSTLCFPIAAMADAFGLAMGAAIKDLDVVKDQGAPVGMFRLADVPEARAGYKAFLGQFSDKQGLCWVKAIGVDIPSDSSGTQAQAIFAKEKSSLAGSYGEPQSFDFRFTGRADSDLEDWMQGIKEADRYFAAIWERKINSDLPDDIKSIGLVLNASSGSVGYLSLEYTFENIERCEQELISTVK